MRKGGDGRPLPKAKFRWWERGNCKDLPVEEGMRIFFPELKPNQKAIETYAEAHEYCKDCPVKTHCRDSAVAEEGRHANGYRGDVEPKARRQLYKERREQNLITESPTAGDGVIAKRNQTNESIQLHRLAAPIRRRHGKNKGNEEKRSDSG